MTTLGGMRIDLNADLGESRERWESGEDIALLSTVTSANVCCGAYAGDEQLMRLTCAAAVKHDVAIGAQVGYPDRNNFGRVHIDMAPEDLTNEVIGQILLLEDIAQEVGGHVAYVKPHGALYNTIVADQVQAEAVVNGLLSVSRALPLLGLPGSVSLRIANSHGIPVVHEGFADRGYTPAGTLIPRSEPGAVLTDPPAVGAQAVRLLHEGIESICVHSDSPGALDLARAVRAALEAEGATVRSR